MKQLKISQKLTTIETDSFKQYLKDIGSITMFSSPEDELIVTKRASLGDRDAIDELVRRNLRFVVSVAKQYTTDGIPLSDLVNEGNVGLIIAAEKFKPSMGYKFISYAVWWIRKIILEHITKHGKLVRIPANKLNSLSKLDKKIVELEQKMGRKVDITEVIDEYYNQINNPQKDNKKTSKVKLDDESSIITYEDDEGNKINDKDFMFLDVLNAYNMDSLDRQIGSEETVSLGELIADESFKPTDHLLSNNDLVSEINESLTILKPRNRKIIESLFGLNGVPPMSLKDVSVEFNLSSEMVRQIKEKSLKALKNNNRIINVFNESN